MTAVAAITTARAPHPPVQAAVEYPVVVQRIPDSAELVAVHNAAATAVDANVAPRAKLAAVVGPAVHVQITA